MADSHPQLVLPLAPAAVRFDTFVASEVNRLAVSGVQAFAEGRLVEPQLFLWGARGCGKTHLLTAACETAREGGRRIAYVGAGTITDRHPEAPEWPDFLCIDDVDALPRTCETVLFNIINRCRASGTALLLAARHPPEGLGVILPDLVTRLGWGPVFRLAALDEHTLAASLQGLFAARGMSVGQDVIDYLLSRCTRDMTAMSALVGRLDLMTLQRQRAVTVPLVRELLVAGGDPESTADAPPAQPARRDGLPG